MHLTLDLPDDATRMGVTGPAERNLKILRESLGITIAARGGQLKLSGSTSSVGQAAGVIEQLGDAAKAHQPMTRGQLLDAISLAATRVDREQASAEHHREVREQVDQAANIRRDRDRHHRRDGDEGPAAKDPSAGWIERGLDVYLPGRRVRAMTEGQRDYLDAIAKHDLTFCTGPAGSGKTYLAVAAAVSMLKAGTVRKLVLVRPAVEAGEKLGFLPGSMQDKVNPYLRPLLDALNDMMEFEHIQRFMAVDLIELIPLAFMRGRTLNDAAVILDEAQNASKAQMLMFLTRLGHGSKMIVTGDASQTDLERPSDSGLVDAIRRLGRVRGVATTALQPTDIVRHRLVQRIVTAYDDAARPRAAEDASVSGVAE